MSDGNALARLGEYEVARAVEKLRESPLRSRAETAILAVLNVIPYAGGSIASVLSAYSTEKKFERVFGTLDALSSAIKDTHTKVEEILTKDQVSELLDEALPQIATVSDDGKLRYLRTGLITSFTSKTLPYDTKHFFLTVLAGLTYLELRVLRVLYCDGDPYEHVVYEQPDPPPDLSEAGLRIACSFRGEVLAGLHAATVSGPAAGRIVVGGLTGGHRSLKEWRDDGQRPRLIEHIGVRIADDPEMVRLVAARLDASGLTKMLPVLQHRQYRVLEQRREAYVAPGSALTLTHAHLPGAGTVLLADAPKFTPIEEARTTLGERLVKFAMSA